MIFQPINGRTLIYIQINETVGAHFIVRNIDGISEGLFIVVVMKKRVTRNAVTFEMLTPNRKLRLSHHDRSASLTMPLSGEMNVTACSRFA